MVVLWCKDCGALLGVRSPLTDWQSAHIEECCHGQAVDSSTEPESQDASGTEEPPKVPAPD